MSVLIMDTPLFRLLFFAVTGLPLVIQDRRSYSVSLTLLLVTLGLWLGWAFFAGDAEGRWMAASLILVSGTLMLFLFPGRLGEADVLFVSGMACLLPFGSWLTAVMAGCGAGLAAFGWLAWISRASIQNVPVPFLPCLYWGGLTVLLGDVLR